MPENGFPKAPPRYHQPGVFAIILGPGVKVRFLTPFGRETTKKQGFGRDAWIAKLIFAMTIV
jgi:hypothetical protein